MPDITAQVVNITSEVTRNGRQKYNVSLSTGQTYALWDPKLMQALSGFILQQPVQLRIRQKPSNDGQRMWEDITHFAPQGQTLPPDGGTQGYVQQPQLNYGGAQPVQPTQPFVPQPAPKTGFDNPDVLQRVVKLNSMEIAATVVAGLLHGAGPEALNQAIDMVEAAGRRIYTVAREHEGGPGAPPSYQVNPQGGVTSAMPPTPSEIAQSVPGVTLGSAVPTDVVDDEGAPGSGWD